MSNEIESYKENNFLETGIVQDLVKKIENLEIKFKESTGEESITIRTKQLIYSKLLVNTYGKDIMYLLNGYSNLGICYLENSYFEQAQEHLLTSFKLNSSIQEHNLEHNELQIKVLINLAKCYLSSDNFQSSVSISEKCLDMNKSIHGESHISNADIYYILAKANTGLKNYKTAESYFSEIFNMFEKEYGYESDKCAKICMELGLLHEVSSNNKEAFEYYTISFQILEKFIESNKVDSSGKVNKEQNELLIILVDLYFKLAELTSLKTDLTSFDTLKQCEIKYGFIFRENMEKRIDIKKRLITYSIKKDDVLCLNEYQELEVCF